jgi:GTP-binding protein EngB required for normal cell division
MEESEKIPSCQQEDCPVRTSGKCLEGLKLEDCTHFYLADEHEETDASLPDDSNAVEERLIRLYNGTELKVAELGLVTNQFDTNLIIIIGESNSGKTTILTSIFDMFQTGKFSKYYFAGSMTQYGFESRCHLSRAPSKAVVPDTAHTTAKDFNFLHISFKGIEHLAGKATHLLISDISGERFNMANNSSPMMNDMTLVKDADHLIYLLDGDKIANKFERNAITTRAGQFITRALDTGLFDLETKLQIVFTKADSLSEMSSNGGLDKIKEEFTSKFQSRLKELTFGIVAARPKPPTEEFKFGHGLQDLLTRWKTREPQPLPVITFDKKSNRYFNLYGGSNG